jgi:hypothetical protein
MDPLLHLNSLTNLLIRFVFAIIADKGLIFNPDKITRTMPIRSHKSALPREGVSIPKNEAESSAKLLHLF